MNRRRLAQAIGASLVGAVAILGSSSARPQAHDDHSNHRRRDSAAADPGKDLKTR